MIKKTDRVKKHEEFQEIIHSKNIEKNNAYIIYYRKNEEHTARVGISVSKKLGNAVVRNKTKRQVRHIVHNVLDKNKNVDLVIIVRANYHKNIFSENQHLMDELLKKIGRKIDEQI